jgi:uncharacterized protein YdhG (YjbR/CyaY superfamily)
MAGKKTAKKATQKSTRGTGLFTAEEKAAMRETIADQKRVAAGAAGEAMVLEKIAAMKEPDRGMAKRIHAIIKANAPSLAAKTWYGMPAYAKGDKIVCFFQDANKFKARYATLGFSDTATLDEGDLWPTSFAVQKLTPASEAKIVALVKKAARA